ncbi:Uncharacterised protein [Amycolatopsis camponoti]|uniref:Uncharacterized protein n=1 Tax=Amycolatopsis camponoti TaxID=2606593 RepID=A0A6I8M5Y4_9PSEU|nr:Uncharacterised protein [Amycolatopsis camponoti]VVJ25422.1 Uncharacterised protein [Amycolatopsis camponoti]
MHYKSTSYNRHYVKWMAFGRYYLFFQLAETCRIFLNL